MALDMGPVLLSLKVSIIATIIVSITGMAAAYFINRFHFTGRSLVETLIGLPLVLPPTVIGFGLLLLFGRNGPVGSFLEHNLHLRIVFTWWAAVIASAIVSLPLMYRSAKSGFAGVDSTLELAARTLGAPEWRVFFTVTLPLALPGILSGVLLSFARALGEFGATMMIAGNIPGQTQTIPLAIFFAAESGDMQTAGVLVAVISAISFIITYGINAWQGRELSVSNPAKGGEKYAAGQCEKNFT